MWIMRIGDWINKVLKKIQLSEIFRMKNVEMDFSQILKSVSWGEILE